MDDWLRIPVGREAPHPVRLCLLMGLTALLLLMLAPGL